MKETLKYCFSIIFFGWLFSFLLCFFIFTTVEFVGEAIDIFDSQIQKDGDSIFEIVKEVSFLMAFAVISFVIYGKQTTVRRQFLADTKALISVKDGLKYHIKHHLQKEIIILAVNAAAFLLLHIVSSSLSPMAILYRILGTYLGIFVSAVVLLLLQTLSILSAQYRWRLGFLLGD